MKKHTVSIAVILILVALFSSIYITKCNKEKQTHEQNMSLLNALNDSLQLFKNKDSDNVATISILETQSISDFLALQVKEKEVLELQSIVKRYKGNLSSGSSVTVTSTETKIKNKNATLVTVPIPEKESKFDWVVVDTGEHIRVARREPLQKELIWPVYEDTVKNEWINYYARMDKDSAILDLKIFNKFTVVLGKDKKRPFADVTTDNPYTEVRTLRTYQVAQPKEKIKRFGIGLSTGVTYIDKWRPYLGAGINYNFIRF